MAKTTLTLDIEYDPELTHPDGLASAMDRLMETALSTPGIMEEYGDPRVGEFFVSAADGSRPKPGPTIILNISGGVLQDVFGSDPAITVALVDWDTEGCDPSDNGIIEIPDGRGGTQLANVAEYPVQPLEQLTGTETEAAPESGRAGVDATNRFRPNGGAPLGALQHRHQHVADHTRLRQLR